MNITTVPNICERIVMKYFINIRVFSLEGLALGFIEGELKIPFAPKVQQTLSLYDILYYNYIYDIPKYLTQQITIEYYKLYEKPNPKGIFGEIMFNNITIDMGLKEEMISFLEEKYHLYYWEY